MFTTLYIHKSPTVEPQIAHADPASAWSAVVDNQKVNFTMPESSRLVRRLATLRSRLKVPEETGGGVESQGEPGRPYRL